MNMRSQSIWMYSCCAHAHARGSLGVSRGRRGTRHDTAVRTFSGSIRSASEDVSAFSRACCTAFAVVARSVAAFSATRRSSLADEIEVCGGGAGGGGGGARVH